MATPLLMPKATAVWLVDNTSLSFEQIAAFCGLHPLEVQGVADGDVASGIMGVNPIQNGQLTREEIEKALEEGIRFVECMDPDEAIPDENGWLKEVSFKRMRQDSGRLIDSGGRVRFPARTLLVAAGTSPNVTYEREHPGSFDLDDRRQFFRAHRRRTNLRWTLIHPREREGVVGPFQCNGCGADAKPKHEPFTIGRDHAFVRQREGAADRRVPRHRQLVGWREDAHADVGIRPLGGKDERAFGEVHLARDRLHGRAVQPAGVGNDRELVASCLRRVQELVARLVLQRARIEIVSLPRAHPSALGEHNRDRLAGNERRRIERLRRLALDDR